MNNFPRPLSFLFSLILLAFLSFPVNAEIVFSGLDLSEDNRLLFRAASGGGSDSARDALFVVPLPASGNGAAREQPRQLSAFPRKMDLLENGRTLQIRNAFGVFRLPVSGGLPVPVPGLASFTGGSSAPESRAEETLPSGDGRWLLCLEPVSPALGNLVMLDVLSGAKIRVASRLDRPEKHFPASWSPDSRFFIYERGGKLYYYAAVSAPVPADEDARFVGDGTVNSISWGGEGDFFYLRGSTLFHVRGLELFTRALYSGFLEIGAAAGRIPFDFDPVFDRFWVAPDAASLLVSKGRRGLFYCPLGADEDDGASVTPLPGILLPRPSAEITVLWARPETATILVSVPNNGETETKTYRLFLEEGKNAFELLPPGHPVSFTSAALSPDGNLALLWGESGIALYDYTNWKLLEILSRSPGKACLWTGNGGFILGDEEKIERFTLTRGPAPQGAEAPGTFIAGRELLCLSRVSGAGFEEGTFRILAKAGDAWFVTDGKEPWAALNNPRLRSPSQVSARYRVYLEKQPGGFYANLPMIRNTASVGTFPLFPPLQNSLPAPSPAGPKEAALCFDLYDDDRGLPETLDALGRFGIKATFFLNGEFLRRHPREAAEIAGAGHEAASLFFTPIDLSDTRYRFGADFIARGLARNEDEYYRATGKELALLWHPPWYAVSREITAAAASAGYVTSGRDLDPLDWIRRDDEKKLGLVRRSSSEMIDYIMAAVKPGSIIPVRLGGLSGGSDDYLFDRVGVLIEALLREGYTLTTVSGILKAR